MLLRFPSSRLTTAVFDLLIQATTTDADRTLLLNAHNAARMRMPATVMPTMVWDSTLEEVAQAYADKCFYGHNGNRYANYTAAGGTAFTSVGTDEKEAP